MRKQEVHKMQPTTQTVPQAQRSASLGANNKETGNLPGNLPEKKYRAGAVSATIWLNKGHQPNGEESEYRTIAIERSYTDREGKWQSTNTLRLNDLPKAQLVLNKAYEFLTFREQELFNRGA